MGYYQTFKVIVLVIFIASSVGECRLTREKLSEIFENRVAPSHSGSAAGGDQGTKWAVLVAGSNGYGNYRHQADICHAYQILKNGGLKDENIIVMMYDDIAFNEENPRRGIIINSPHGPDVYKGVPKDYTREEVTASNLLGVILGDETAVSGGSRKVVKSSPNDHIFIYYADHGGPGVLTMPTGEDLYAKDLIDTLKKKHASGTYKSMVIYIEACEAGSMFEGMLGEGMNIYVTTASNPDESSWATYCPGFDPSPPKEYETCLGDLYSVAWMEDSDTKNPQKETLEDQYKVVKTRTGMGKEHSSHVIQYGNINLSKEYLSIYMGISFDKGKKHHKFATMLDNQSKWSSLSVVEQHEANLVYLKEKYNRAEEGTEKKEKAKKELEKAISHRMHVDRSIEALGPAVFGGETSAKLLHTVRPSGQPLVDDWDCLKSMVQMYKKYCGNLSSYGKKYMRVFANMCNAGVRPDQMAQASSRVCKMT